MAWYKDPSVLKKSDTAAYDKIHKPGDIVPHSGIYRCQGCRHEIASNENDPFPPQNHHQHTQQQGAIRWKLIVYADHDPK
jgi:hypothetical protein